MAATSKESTYNCKYFPPYNSVLICTLHVLDKTSEGYKQACNSTARYKQGCDSLRLYCSRLVSSKHTSGSVQLQA